MIDKFSIASDSQEWGRFYEEIARANSLIKLLKGAVEMNDTQILDWINENVVEIHYGDDGKITMVALLGDNYIKKAHIGISLRECVNGILSIPD